MGSEFVVDSLLYLGKVALVPDLVEGGEACVLEFDEAVFEDAFIMFCDVDGSEFSSFSPFGLIFSFVVDDVYEIFIERILILIRVYLHT